mgnify:CR=1 FL=1
MRQAGTESNQLGSDRQSRMKNDIRHLQAADEDPSSQPWEVEKHSEPANVAERVTHGRADRGWQEQQPTRPERDRQRGGRPGREVTPIEPPRQHDPEREQQQGKEETKTELVRELAARSNVVRQAS